MNGRLKKHTLRFDRTEFTFIGAGKYCGLTQHSVWVENYMGCFSAPADRCLRVPKIRRQTGNRILEFVWRCYMYSPNGPKILASSFDHCILCKKIFPLFDCRCDGLQKTPSGIDGCASEMAYPQGLVIPFSVTVGTSQP